MVFFCVGIWFEVLFNNELIYVIFMGCRGGFLKERVESVMFVVMDVIVCVCFK